MNTIFQSLKSISNYPVPATTIEEAAEDFGLKPEGEATASVRNGRNFLLAKAKMYDFLAEAPNISQAGISYTFSESEKKRFKAKADAIRSGLGYEDISTGSDYGYQGENL